MNAKQKRAYHSERFLRYPGSKGRTGILHLIRSYFPDDYAEYREPFCGSASVALSLPTWIPRWINDVNPHLIKVFKALKETPNELIESCVSIPPATPDDPVYISPKGYVYPKRLKEKYDELIEHESADPALRYLFLNRTAFQGRVVLDPSRRSRNNFTNPKGWSWDFFERLDRVADALADVRITCGDFTPLLRADGADVLVYADAPYMCDTRCSSKLYEFGLTDADHRRLRDWG